MNINLNLSYAVIILSFFNCTPNKNYQAKNESIKITSPIEELKKNIKQKIAVSSANLKDTTFQYKDFVKDPTKIIKDSTSIRIILNNQENIILKNQHNPLDETENTTYQYHGFEESTNLFWIIKELYEGEKNLIISKESGKVYEVGNAPKINLSGTLLFTKQNDCFMVFEDCSPGLQIWKINKGELELFEEVKLENYFVSNGGWKTNNILLVELMPIKFLTMPDSQHNKKYLYELKIN